LNFSFEMACFSASRAVINFCQECLEDIETITPRLLATFACTVRRR